MIPPVTDVGGVESLGMGVAPSDDAAALPSSGLSPAVSALRVPAANAGHRPRLLDLCCKAGGASVGYEQAGFDVVGVDAQPQPRYPFEFVWADMFDLTPEFFASFDAIHASPSCQGYTSMRHAPGAIGKPREISRTRAMLEATGKPYVIENVEGAKDEMPGAITLCGSMFGLGIAGFGEPVAQLQRHRLFQCIFPVKQPACRHDQDVPVVGVYGGHARIRAATFGGRGTRDSWIGGHKAAASEAMGIDWMTLAELSEAIPPAYTRFIGEQLMRHLAITAKAA